jgi:hypothetical protein
MLQKIGSMLWENRFLIAVIFFAVAQAISAWRETKSKLYSMMLDAKRKAKDQILSSGDQQIEWVIKLALEKLPWLVKALGEEWTIKLVKWLYRKGKDWLDDGKMNNSVQ